MTDNETIFTVEDEIDAAWALSGANRPVTEADSEAAREALTDYDFMPTMELEEIVGLGDKGTPEYEAAQRALLRRPEYRPGHSEGQFYRGHMSVPAPGKGKGMG